MTRRFQEIREKIKLDEIEPVAAYVKDFKFLLQVCAIYQKAMIRCKPEDPSVVVAALAEVEKLDCWDEVL